MNQEILNRYLTGDASAEEKQMVVRWLDADPQHMREYLALRKLHDITLWQEKPATTVDKKKRLTLPYIREFIKIAAIFLIAVTSVYFLTPERGKDTPDLKAIHVPSGQRAELTLGDGTRVCLNSNTTLTFPDHFDRKERRVTLDGEGYFQVAKNEKKPFIVQAKEYEVRVLGTEFNVMMYKDQDFFETVLLKGSVEVNETTTGRKVKLQPNERLFGKAGQLRKESISEWNRALWMQGILYFDNTRMDEIIRQLGLYYDVKFILKKDSLANVRFTGKFRIRDGVEHVLKVLQLKCKFTYQRDEDSNTITIN